MDRSSTLKVAGIAEREAARALESIRPARQPRPFHVSFLVRDEESWSIKAQYGSLVHDQHDRRRSCYCDVRVGSYRNDQVQDGGLADNSNEDESYSYLRIPLGTDTKAVGHSLWRIADSRYREAAEALANKHSHELTYLDRNHEFPSFERRKPLRKILWSELPEFDHDYWQDYVMRTSRVPLRHKRVKVSNVKLTVNHLVRTYVTADGSRMIESSPYWSLQAYLWHLSDKGDGTEWTVSHFVTDPDELPEPSTFAREVRNAIGTLEKLATAPTVRGYSGPVLLDPGPAGLLFHEALGHRLEGNRMLSTGEGQTFRDSVGSEILPTFLSLYDDPRLTEFEDQSLVGHYRMDDEGVLAERASLIERGHLRGFLTSRAGIAKKHRSNGHGRTSAHQRPISRMGITVVDSHEGLSARQLKDALIDEIKSQELPFGIRILRASGGETATESYNFQAFLGQIDLAAKVYPDGREELIRGVDFVGTPLNAVRSILAAGDKYNVDNAYCGAESGWVPVSTVSPAVLVSHLELQAKHDTPYSQYVYPMPWE